MIIGFTTLFAITTSVLAVALLLAAGALAVALGARRDARAARTVASIAELRMTELEAAVTAATTQLASLTAERERERGAPTRPSLREAVALSRHGASVEELMSTCRIGQSEARLIQMLYGTPRIEAATDAAHEVH